MKKRKKDMVVNVAYNIEDVTSEDLKLSKGLLSKRLFDEMYRTVIVPSYIKEKNVSICTYFMRDFIKPKTIVKNCIFFEGEVKENDFYKDLLFNKSTKEVHSNYFSKEGFSVIDNEFNKLGYGYVAIKDKEIDFIPIRPLVLLCLKNLDNIGMIASEIATSDGTPKIILNELKDRLEMVKTLYQDNRFRKWFLVVLQTHMFKDITKKSIELFLQSMSMHLLRKEITYKCSIGGFLTESNVEKDALYERVKYIRRNILPDVNSILPDNFKFSIASRTTKNDFFITFKIDSN